ncbi:GTP-binding protein 2 [Cyphellophora attinorum]|uniref:GTP-binding protein 2 n=1 Tax=Cyphellophora attinorum TaxID=1664694 RepID=A0A0N0NLF0_9EURO|nr:GTP-binding protein 2 [Phialophora attinorum]KPI39221.1 GTP-binding protein 2 [Phialophora attinorum]
MSSIFTFQDELPRIQSPWSTPGTSTPQTQHSLHLGNVPGANADGRSRLEPEKQDGPCEYKLHLLLRPRRHFVSTSTASVGSTAPLPLRPAPIAALSTSGRSVSDTFLRRASYQPSPQTRQARLQQLTTQLLWRLQQSSPFHSSSNAELVLPLLPEATPRLGVPDRPARLLPGLEESQGALYEIGVADDGTLVGLIEDELEESLNNLRAMAASLGCVVDILRKVVVGDCVWSTTSDEQDPVQHEATLYAAEVLVQPDSRSSPAKGVIGDQAQTSQHSSEAARPVSATEQLRVVLTGSSAAGKSSLLGTLTTSSLDNGRGKSRLSLLKHRHEISSGITSSVAHELLGYKTGDAPDFVVNYSSGDVSTWTDIHGLADRLCFALDSPGLARFGKSTYRALISWKPDWTCVCIAADDVDVGTTPQPLVNETFADSSLAHLDLCLKLGLSIVVVITKMDLATKTRLRTILARILTCLKGAGKKPVLLSVGPMPTSTFSLDSTEPLLDTQHVTTDESTEVDSVVTSLQAETDETLSVPIVMTSTVSGSGIGKLHRLLSRLPIRSKDVAPMSDRWGETKQFQVDEVFSIPPVRIYNAEHEARAEFPSGVVLCGRVDRQSITVDDSMFLGPFSNELTTKVTAPRSKSLSAQDLRRPSFSADHMPFRANDQDRTPSHAFVRVRVVSLRNLRLPVRQLSVGDVGTIGVEAFGHGSLTRARKGMVLSSEDLSANVRQGFVASFPANDFLVASPPLILGGHATVYFNSARAAIKVVALELVEDSENQGASLAEVFAFDGDQDREEDVGQRSVNITVRFANTVECVREGDQVLVVPTFSAAGPVTGPVSSTGSMTGFVGTIVGTVP